MTNTEKVGWAVVVFIIVVGGIYWWSMMQTTAPANTGFTPATSTQGAEVSTSTPGTSSAGETIIGNNLALGTDSKASRGTYLVGYSGMAVYKLAKDTASTSTCYDACAQTWQPYIIGSGDNINNLQAGINGAVGTTTRTDGTIQLTYRGHPLYFYSSDSTSSDTKGQGIGGVWSIVKP